MNSRNKGKRGELEVAHLLQKYGYETRRGQQFSGANGDADVVGLPGIHIEVKRVEKLNIDDALQQSIRDAKEAEVPIVMHRKNRTEWKITMRFEDWMEMYEAWEKNK
jgi:Holliday junction resolvase